MRILLLVLLLSGCGVADECDDAVADEIQLLSDSMNGCSEEYGEPCVLISVPVSQEAVLYEYLNGNIVR